MRVLVIEDEPRLAAFIKRGLKEQGFAVDLASDGEEGFFMAREVPYDVVVLDVMLPGKDGLCVCRALRKDGVTTPILMLTARDGVEEKVQGLDSGADDYLTKPFAFAEFLARIRALIRRRDRSPSPVLRVADLEMNTATRKVTRAGRAITLTATEFALLEFLMRHAGEVVTRTMIIEHVWNDDAGHFSNVVDVYINYLRRKIDDGFETKLIHSVRGVGYVLKEE